VDVVIKVPYVLKVDKQGRVVLPIEVRRKLGVLRGGSLVLKKTDNRIFIDAGGDLEESVRRWKERIKSFDVDAKTFEPGESKWLSEDWARRKLGIRV
jgi:AbrB family looped-hinge helix DNA binding protein